MIDFYVENKVTKEQFHIHLYTDRESEVDSVLDQHGESSNCRFITKEEFIERDDLMTIALLDSINDRDKVGYLRTERFDLE